MPVRGRVVCLGLSRVDSLELFAVLFKTWLWWWGFFFVSCLLYQSRSRDLFIGWEYCVLSHKETQTGLSAGAGGAERRVISHWKQTPEGQPVQSTEPSPVPALSM